MTRPYGRPLGKPARQEAGAEAVEAAAGVDAAVAVRLLPNLRPARHQPVNPAPKVRVAAVEEEVAAVEADWEIAVRWWMPANIRSRSPRQVRLKRKQSGLRTTRELQSRRRTALSAARRFLSWSR